LLLKKNDGEKHPQSLEAPIIMLWTLKTTKQISKIEMLKAANRTVRLNRSPTPQMISIDGTKYPKRPEKWRNIGYADKAELKGLGFRSL
jgi:hypothetical protein